MKRKKARTADRQANCSLLLLLLLRYLDGCSPLSDLINIDGPTEAGLEVARDRGLVCEPPSRVPPRDFV